jgi:hypothetical protein
MIPFVSHSHSNSQKKLKSTTCLSVPDSACSHTAAPRTPHVGAGLFIELLEFLTHPLRGDLKPIEKPEGPIRACTVCRTTVCEGTRVRYGQFADPAMHCHVLNSPKRYFSMQCTISSTEHANSIAIPLKSHVSKPQKKAGVSLSVWIARHRILHSHTDIGLLRFPKKRHRNQASKHRKQASQASA